MISSLEYRITESWFSLKNQQRVLILGAGRQGAETVEIASAMVRQGVNLVIMGFIDDKSTAAFVNGHPVLGGQDKAIELLKKNPETKMITAIGNPEARMQAVNRYEDLGYDFTNLPPCKANIL